jgi:DNA polymerase III delta subunit
VPVLTPAAVRTQLSGGTPAPVYLLVGDDEREVADLVAAFTSLVEEDLRPFNVERVHVAERAGDAEAAAVEAARVLPMMAARRVVFLLRAERLLKPKGRRAAQLETDAETEEAGGPVVSGALEAYLQSPEPLSTLVVVASDVNKTLRPVKALYKQASVVECWGLKDGREAKGWELPAIQRKAEAWVARAASSAGARIDPDAARLLAERAGADMGRLRADFDRLQLYVGTRPRMTRADAEAVIGAVTSQDDWAVTNAIERGDTAEALRQLALQLDAGGVSYQILGQLGFFVRQKLPGVDPRRVPAAVAALFRTDLDLKSSGGDPRVLLERLVVELSAGARPSGSGRRGPIAVAPPSSRRLGGR